jgi:hypothetical protein
MLAATLLGVFLVPPLFVMVERMVGKKGAHEPQEAAAPPVEAGEARAQ